MTGNHSLTRAEFDATAAGDPDAATIGKLLAGVLSKRVVMLRAILQRATERCPAALPALEAAYGLLAGAQAADPAAVEAVLTHPGVGTWASGCLRRIQRAGAAAVPPAGGTGQLAAIAAAAAIRARHAFTLDVPLRDGAVMLPTLGLATFPGTTAQTATVSSDGVHASIAAGGQYITIPRDPAADAEGWLGLRKLRSHAAGISIVLDFDDVDPARYDGSETRSPRCDNASLSGWQSGLDGAWEILATQYPHRARALAAGLRVIVPLQPTENRSGISVTTADAFGAISITRPADPLRFGESLIHEFHHSVLYAVSGWYRLHDAGPEAEHYSPWRDDPRPFDGVMHGAYAFLGAADFWRGQRATLTGPDLRAADCEFARWRDEVAHATNVLLDSGKLTAPGTALARGMAATASQWLDLPVDEEAATVASRLAADHRLLWRLRNRRPDPDVISSMTDAWLADQPCPVDRRDVPATVVAQSRLLSPSDRASLCNQRLRNPEAIDQSRYSAGDLAYARDDFARALSMYRSAIGADPEDDDAWAGLALTLTASGRTEGIAGAPEIARAVYIDAVGRGGTPGVITLDCWLAQPAVVTGLRAGI